MNTECNRTTLSAVAPQMPTMTKKMTAAKMTIMATVSLMLRHHSARFSSAELDLNVDADCSSFSVSSTSLSIFSPRARMSSMFFCITTCSRRQSVIERQPFCAPIGAQRALALTLSTSDWMLRILSAPLLLEK